MQLTDRQRNLINLTIRCYDREISGARLSPSFVEDELGADLSEIYSDLEDLTEAGLVEPLAIEMTEGGEGFVWILKPTDKGKLLNMGLDI